MTTQKEMYENFPLSEVIMTNVLNFLGFTFGAILISFLNTSLGIIYFLFCIGTLVWVLKVRCSNCYYYGKRCVAGYGIISSKLFKKGDPEKFHQSVKYTIPIVYTPVFIGLYLVITELSTSIFIVFLLYLIISLIRMIAPKFAPQKVSCIHCKQKANCKLGLSISA